MTNQERTILVSKITGINVEVLILSTKLLKILHLEQYFPPAVSNLLHRYIDTFFIFRDKYKTGIYDGLSYHYTYFDSGSSINALGLGDSALSDPVDYQTFLVLHELTHIVTRQNNHNDTFHSYLDMLIMETK